MNRYLVLVGWLVGCSSSSDYGRPTDQTEISVIEDGGFAPEGQRPTGFHLVGTTATYTSVDGATESVQLRSDVVADMIAELEDVEFLNIGDLSGCKIVGADAPFATITADLSAGSNEVQYDLNCDLKDVSQLVTRLFNLSGFSTWTPPSS